MVGSPALDGELITISLFDAVTGRYRSQIILNGIITAIRRGRVRRRGSPVVDQSSAGSGSNCRPSADGPILRIRVRAMFSSGTTWLIFPTIDATPWSEVILDPLPEPEDEE